MSTTPANGGAPPGPASQADPTGVYRQTQDSEGFAHLRHRFRSFVFPMTFGFCAWYLLYVLMSNYAPGVMDTVVFGHVNVAFVFGVLQFASTFLIAWWYARYAGRRIDPEAERIRGEVEGGAAAVLQRKEAVR